MDFTTVGLSSLRLSLLGLFSWRHQKPQEGPKLIPSKTQHHKNLVQNLIKVTETAGREKIGLGNLEAYVSERPKLLEAAGDCSKEPPPIKIVTSQGLTEPFQNSDKPKDASRVTIFFSTSFSPCFPPFRPFLPLICVPGFQDWGLVTRKAKLLITFNCYHPSIHLGFLDADD